MLRWSVAGSLLAALAVGTPGVASASSLPAGFSDQLVTAGFDFPVGMDFLRDGRLFVAERSSGLVRLVVGGAIAAGGPVLAVDSLQIGNPEQGLLGVAVDPDFPARPYLYVQYNYLGAPRMLLRRYTLTGDLAFEGDGVLVADPASERTVLADVIDNYGNHNAGTIRFGPDGKLYVALGDDLGGCPAQDLTQLFGKILRLDVALVPDGPGPPPSHASIAPADNPFAAHPDSRARLVWQYGLRNPWSFHFDSQTGDAFIADVGGSLYEEIDLADAPGLNFGWPYFEGPDAALTCTIGSGFVAPIHFYDRRGFQFGAAIVSAGLYRVPPGAAAPFPAEYDGSYFFSDVGEGFLRRLVPSGTAWVVAPPSPGQPNPTDWGTGFDYATHYLQAPDGSLWYLKYDFGPSGQVRRIVHDGVTSVGTPTRGALGLAVHPAPSRGAVRVSFRLANEALVRLEVVDVGGRHVADLGRGWRAAGTHHAPWDGRDDDGRLVPAGLYLVRLAAGAHRESVRLPIVR
jgi:glucose/arabinose dehydrogenase